MEMTYGNPPHTFCLNQLLYGALVLQDSSPVEMMPGTSITGCLADRPREAIDSPT